MKVVIVGAGICGLYLAWKLAEKGEDVTVFEKRDKIGKEVCSGLFSQRILEFIPESKNLIKNKIDYCFICFPKRTLKIQFSSQFYVMNHHELDSLVFDLAKKAGAKIILKQPVNSTPEGFNRIIGCDGALSQIRKGLGLKNPKFYLGIQGFLKKNDNSSYVETWPTKNGFIWKIPRGKEIEWGIIERAGEAKKLFNAFLKEKNINLEKIKAAIVPQGLILPFNSKITLCGDAAGLTKPWSGGGVIWGIITANILLKNFPDFLKYQKEIKKFFLPKIILGNLAKKLVYFLGFNFPYFLPKNFQIEGDFLIG